LLPPLIAVTIISFLMIHLIPGDPARHILGDFATEEQLQALRHALGLDQPIYIQYFHWMTNIFHGRLGTSMTTNIPVSDLIAGRMIATLQLTISSWILAIVIGLLLGITAAVHMHSPFDYASMFTAVFFMSMPYFWFGLMLMLIFGVWLGILPVSGSGGWKNLIMPVITLGLPQIALLARLARSSMLDVLEKDYIGTARAKGLPSRLINYKHALRNALIPITTILFLQIPWLFGGAVVTETVFAWPGMGRLLVTSVFNRDYPVIQAIILIIGIMTVISNFLADIVYGFIDPRTRHGEIK